MRAASIAFFDVAGLATRRRCCFAVVVVLDLRLTAAVRVLVFVFEFFEVVFTMLPPVLVTATPM